MQAFESKLLAIMPSKVSSVISRTFRCMEIAEQEIRRAKHDNPQDSDRIDSAFGVLFPTEVLRNKDEHVYRMHARELIERARIGASERELRFATDAEMLAWLSDASLIAPPGSQHAALQEDLFLRVMVLPTNHPLEKRMFREPWVGASEEMRQKLRSMLSSDRRVS